jgi:hypothetical protein
MLEFHCPECGLRVAGDVLAVSHCRSDHRPPPNSSIGGLGATEPECRIEEAGRIPEAVVRKLEARGD